MKKISFLPGIVLGALLVAAPVMGEDFVTVDYDGEGLVRK